VGKRILSELYAVNLGFVTTVAKTVLRVEFAMDYESGNDGYGFEIDEMADVSQITDMVQTD
jgi:hypothetical protein